MRLLIAAVLVAAAVPGCKPRSKSNTTPAPLGFTISEKTAADSTVTYTSAGCDGKVMWGVLNTNLTAAGKTVKFQFQDGGSFVVQAICNAEDGTVTSKALNTEITGANPVPVPDDPVPVPDDPADPEPNPVPVPDPVDPEPNPVPVPDPVDPEPNPVPVPDPVDPEPNPIPLPPKDPGQNPPKDGYPPPKDPGQNEPCKWKWSWCNGDNTRR